MTQPEKAAVFEKELGYRVRWRGTCYAMFDDNGTCYVPLYNEADLRRVAKNLDDRKRATRHGQGGDE